jgi:hypothetical protein
VEERRAAYIGSVGIGFSVPRLVQAALEQIQVRDARLVLYDSGDSQTGAPALPVRQQAAGPVLAPGDQFNVVLPIDFNNRHWHADFSAPKASWYSRFDTWLPWLAMACGFTGSLLFFLLFHTLSSSRMRAVKMAKEMTRELRTSQARCSSRTTSCAAWPRIRTRSRNRNASASRAKSTTTSARTCWCCASTSTCCARAPATATRACTRAQHMLGQIDRTIKSVRHIINDLRPTVLDLGLNAAVEWQIAQFRQRSGMVCELIEHDPTSASTTTAPPPSSASCRNR